ncbi:MAG: hypothetical protein D6808_06095 [Candidatus Dadabacteria bacterium]|nr:MAG: hypothetical protein D6808_06095 [Candidatus Dadabacteria bacterium]
MKKIIYLLSLFFLAVSVSAQPVSDRSPVYGFDFIGATWQNTWHYTESSEKFYGMFSGYDVAAQPYTLTRDVKAKELWFVWDGFGASTPTGPYSPDSYTVNIFSSYYAFQTNPLQGDILNYTLNLPDLGDPVNPYGMDVFGDPTWLMGFDISQFNITLNANQEYFYLVYGTGQFNVAASGIQDSWLPGPAGYLGSSFNGGPFSGGYGLWPLGYRLVGEKPKKCQKLAFGTGGTC